MSRWHSYLNSAKQILLLYKGEEPFSSFLKKYFAREKKFGSTDRRKVSHLCYCYFRLGKALPAITFEERILAGLFFCSDKPNKLLEELRPDLNEKLLLSIENKFLLFNDQYSITNVFPWKNELSNGVEDKKFCESFFIQPDLFLRLRPGKESRVKDKLQQAGIEFNSIAATTLSITNASKIDEIIGLDKEAVVQDYSSQRVGELLPLTVYSRPVTVWDCCAASGGKSIMAKDILGDIDLTVSDVRDSILVNLKKRFTTAGITNYKSFIADLTKPVSQLKNEKFKLILADVPCTGSGTWSRTPEQLYYFDEKKISEYAALQKKILTTIIPQLAPGGYLLYITCSVFKKENEEAVDFIKEHLPAGKAGFNLELIKMELLKGYDNKADTMFAALLSLPK